jgi:hypothetical protein
MMSMRVSLSATMLILAVAPASRARADEGAGSTFFSHFALGGGGFFLTHEGEQHDVFSSPAIGLDHRIGVTIAGHVSFFLLTSTAFNDYKATRDYARWVFKKEDQNTKVAKIAFLTWFIPFVPFADSQTIFGPGIGYRFLREGPTPFVELAGGFTMLASLAHDRFVVGGAVAGGMGFEITEHIGVLVRVIWAPPSLQSRWTPTDSDAISAIGLIQIR